MEIDLKNVAILVTKKICKTDPKPAKLHLNKLFQCCSMLFKSTDITL